MVILSKIYTLMGGDGIDLYKYMRKQSREYNVTKGLEMYDPKCHAVTKKHLRPDKIIYIPNGQKDPVTGADILVQSTSPVARVPIGFEKYIISQKGSFARGSGVTLKPSYDGSVVFDRVYNNWYDNKTDFDLKDIAVRMMAETQVAVIFFASDDRSGFDTFRFKYKIVSPSKGDKLEPFFDQETGDMVAFGREYDFEEEGKTINRYDLYMINANGVVEIIRYRNGQLYIDDRGETIVTTFTKLPIVYWEQAEPECIDTEELRKEFESGFSDFLTQMGYSADPILFGKGTVLNLPAKGSAGKFIEGSQDADLKFVTPDNATESRDLQFRMLQKFIFSLNRAVLLDLDTMKDLGDVSGAALERYLLDAYMEATDKQQGDWGKGVQRMVNWLLHEWRRLVGGDEKLRIDIKFSKFSVRDEADQVELAMKANGGQAVVDLETSVQMAGLVDDVDATVEKIRNEQRASVVAPVQTI